MPDEPRDATAEELANEEGLRRFEAEAAFHQSNILPLDSAMNEGRFFGLLIRRGQPLTTAQRVGFLLIGTIFCGPGICSALAADSQLRDLIGNTFLTAVWFLAGMRIIWVALRATRAPGVNG